MTTTIAFIAVPPGFLPIMLGWLCGVFVIIGVFLFNRSRRRDQPHE